MVKDVLKWVFEKPTLRKIGYYLKSSNFEKDTSKAFTNMNSSHLKCSLKEFRTIINFLRLFLKSVEWGIRVHCE